MATRAVSPLAIRVITLDFSGTLARISRGGPGAHYAEALAEQAGIALSPHVLNRTFGDAFKAASRVWPNFGAGRLSNDDWWRLVIQRCVIDAIAEQADSAQQRAGWMARFGEREAALGRVLLDRFASRRCYDVFADTIPALETLRSHPATRHIALRVATNFPETIRPLLGSLGLSPFFERVHDSRTERVAKPDPLFLVRACAPHDARAALHVGDSLVDVESALGAGYAGVWLLDRDGSGAVRRRLTGAQAEATQSASDLLGFVAALTTE